MYDIILITTGNNEVREKIENQFESCFIVDCSVNDKLTVMEALENAVSHKVKVILTYRCPYIIPKTIFSIATIGSYNIHPSLLPNYPGLNPWNEIFKDKIKHSGVSLHRLDVIPDSGDIIYSDTFDIEDHDTIDTARRKSDFIAAKLLERLITSYLK